MGAVAARAAAAVVVAVDVRAGGDVHAPTLPRPRRSRHARPMLRAATAADELELRAIAEAEGADTVSIRKKELKTGRQIWTLGG